MQVLGWFLMASRMRWFAAITAAALLASVGRPTPSRADAESNSDRILASIPVPPEHGNGYTALAVSGDERYVYYIGTRGERKAASGAMVGTDAHLLIYDVADPRHTRLASDTPMGDITPITMAVRAGRLILLYAADAASSDERLAVIDSTDPSQPRARGNIAINGWGLQLTDDGRFAQLALRGSATPKQAIVDLGNPDHPVLAGPDAHPGAMRPATSTRIEGFHPDSFVLDSVGPLALTNKEYTLLIWDRSEPARPKVAQEIGVGRQISLGRLLPSRHAIVATSLDDLLVISTEELPVSTDGLRRIHERLRSTYEAQQGKEESSDLAERLAVQLADAGARSLIAGSPPGLAPNERLAILDDFGLWLSQGSEPEKSIDVLKKAVELAPANAALRLHLAEAAHNAIAHEAAFAAKRDLAQLAVDSYAAYRTLTGYEAPGAAGFDALNIAGAASGDVCSYVAAFYNRGRQQEMFADKGPVDIDNDGRIDDVGIGYNGMGGPQMVQPEEWNEKFSFPPDPDSGSYSWQWEYAIHFLPFQNTTYLLAEIDGGPVSVTQANVGPVCWFSWRFAASLTVDADPIQCARAVAGTDFDKVPVSSDQVPAPMALDFFPSFVANFSGVAAADIDGSGRSARVGYFTIASTASRGCDVFGITILDGDLPEDSTRNRSLQEAQKQLMDCRGSRAFLVRVGNTVLIEIDGGSAYQRSQPPRTLLRMNGDKVETVCRVDQRPAYVPQSVSPQ
jgi:hypothetical protein